jgi:hypothetical protein
VRFAEAAAVIEDAVEERFRNGLVVEVEAFGCEIAGPDCVVIYAWFINEPEPLMVIVDLDGEPVTEESCDEILRALRAPAMTVH